MICNIVRKETNTFSLKSFDEVEIDEAEDNEKE